MGLSNLFSIIHVNNTEHYPIPHIIHVTEYRTVEIVLLIVKIVIFKHKRASGHCVKRITILVAWLKKALKVMNVFLGRSKVTSLLLWRLG